MKKKPAAKPAKVEKKPVIYLEVDPDIKLAVEELAKKNRRTLTGEVLVALDRHLAENKVEK